MHLHLGFVAAGCANKHFRPFRDGFWSLTSTGQTDRSVWWNALYMSSMNAWIPDVVFLPDRTELGMVRKEIYVYFVFKLCLTYVLNTCWRLSTYLSVHLLIIQIVFVLSARSTLNFQKIDEWIMTDHPGFQILSCCNTYLQSTSIIYGDVCLWSFGGSLF